MERRYVSGCRPAFATVAAVDRALSGHCAVSYNSTRLTSHWFLNISRQRLRQFWLLAGWLLVVAVIYESLTSEPIELRVDQGDKLLHTAAYLVLMSWFANHYEGRRERLICAAGFVALGVGLEFLQRLTATRTFEVADMAAGAAGVIIGWILAPPRLPNCLRLLEQVVNGTRRD
jgi:VanZ family protein